MERKRKNSTVDEQEASPRMEQEEEEEEEERVENFPVPPPLTAAEMEEMDRVDRDYFDKLPSGYRFVPTGEELIRDYLKNKILNLHLPKNRIRDVDIYKYHPHQLTSMYKSHRGKEWYFFTPRTRKYPRGNRPDRAAGNGFWLASGTDDQIYTDEGVKIGRKKTLNYYIGEAKEKTNAYKTDWIMHEYINENERKDKKDANNNKLDECVLCVIYEKPSKKGEAKGNRSGVVSDNVVNLNEKGASPRIEQEEEEEERVEKVPPPLTAAEMEEQDSDDLDKLPSGYRFVPTREELIRDNLKNKILNLPLPKNRIQDVNIYDYHPHQLTSMYKLHSEKKCYFFTSRSRKYGNRADRTAGNGIWIGKSASVPIRSDEGVKIGTKRTFNYWERNAGEKKGVKTDWIMHEYIVENDRKTEVGNVNNVGQVVKKDENHDMKDKKDANDKLDGCVLCMIYEKTSNKGEVKENRPEENDTVTVPENEEQLPNQSQIGVVSDNAINLNEQALNPNTNQIPECKDGEVGGPDETLSSNERRTDIVEHNFVDNLNVNEQVPNPNTNQIQDEALGSNERRDDIKELDLFK